MTKDQAFDASEIIPADQLRTRDRIAALLLTAPFWTGNYTTTIETAAWLAAEAERVGWNLQVTDRGPAE